jgi:hypothetical protein
MFAASADIFVIDFFFRPFAKIGEKMPWIALLFTCILYGIIGYVVLRSVYLADQKH